MSDVLVIGGGAAGWSAALAARQQGLSVTLLEKLGESGGSSVLSGGCLAFAGTDLQAANGIADSAELLFEDLREVGEHRNDEALVRTYCDTQLETYEWLKSAGVRFSPVIETASGQSVPRVHLDPADMVRQLAAAATGVDYRPDCAAQSLIQDGDGRVTGVRSSGGDIPSNHVIIASGGFAKNPDLIALHAPHYLRGRVHRRRQPKQGDGLRMGVEARCRASRHGVRQGHVRQASDRRTQRP